MSQRVEYNASRGLGVVSVVALAPFTLEVVNRVLPGELLASICSRLGSLPVLLPVVAAIFGLVSLTLLAVVHRAWGTRPPLVVPGVGAAVGIAGFAGANVSHADTLPRIYLWGLLALVLGLLAYLVWLHRTAEY